MKHCPVCHRPITDQHAPFCSERCRKVDLGRWFTGTYVIAGEETISSASEDGMFSQED